MCCLRFTLICACAYFSQPIVVLSPGYIYIIHKNRGVYFVSESVYYILKKQILNIKTGLQQQQNQNRQLKVSQIVQQNYNICENTRVLKSARKTFLSKQIYLSVFKNNNK